MNAASITIPPTVVDAAGTNVYEGGDVVGNSVRHSTIAMAAVTATGTATKEENYIARLNSL